VEGERDVPERWLKVFEAIVKRGDRGLREDFIAVGGSSENADALVAWMTSCGMVAPERDGGRTVYMITPEGRVLHQLLRSNRVKLRPLFDVLRRTRLPKVGKAPEDSPREGRRGAP